MQILSTDEARLQCEKMMKATPSGRIFSAFFTMPAARWILENSPKNLKLVVRGRASDFVCGAADLDAINLIMSEGHSVFFNLNLHAKVYHFGSEILLGSSNLTTNGLNLMHQGGNIELNSVVPATPSNVTLLDRIVNSSYEVDAAVFQKLDTFLESIKDKEPTQETSWPDETFNELTETNLWISELPNFHFQDAVSEDYYVWGEISRLARSGNIDAAKNILKQTLAYKWLEPIVSKSGNRGINFGKVSNLLHDAINDDPTPRRLEIKEYQENLYSFVEAIDDNIEVFRPNISQILRIKG